MQLLTSDLVVVAFVVVGAGRVTVGVGSAVVGAGVVVDVVGAVAVRAEHRG
jgi:hypothetical protein